jgi:hypothetical protein
MPYEAKVYILEMNDKVEIEAMKKNQMEIL